MIVMIPLTTSDLIELEATWVGSEYSGGWVTANLANHEDGDGLGLCP